MLEEEQASGVNVFYDGSLVLHSLAAFVGLPVDQVHLCKTSATGMKPFKLLVLNRYYE